MSHLWILCLFSMIRKNREYFDYIAYDADDVIRRRLKFIPTPVFMVLDENNVVRYLHRPTAADVPMSVAMLLKKHCSPRAVPD